MESGISVQRENDPPPAADNPYKGYTWGQLQDALVEKEYQLECAKDSIDQLSVCKAEGVKKDSIIASLRKELATHKKNSWSKDLSCVSMEERLAKCEGHLQEKMEEVKTLQKELEETRSELKAAVGRSVATHKKMSDTLTQRDQDMQKLQRQHTVDEARLEGLQQELAQKKSDILSLQERVKRLQNTNQSLQKKLEESQSQYGDVVKSEQKLIAEVAQLKTHSSDGKLLQAKHDFIEDELTKSKEKQRVMALELGTLREELATLCENVSSLTGSDGDGHSPTATISAVSKLAQKHSEANSKLTIVTQQLEQLSEEHSSLCNCLERLQQSWTDCKEAMSDDPLGGVNSLMLSLQSLQSQDCLKDLVVAMQDVLTDVHSFSSAKTKTLTQLIDRVIASYNAVDDRDSEETDPLSMVIFLSETLQSTIQEMKQLKQKLCGTEMEHSAALMGAVTALRHDEEARLSRKVEKMREEEKMKYDHQINKLKHVWESKKDEAVREVEAKSEVITAELGNLQQVYEDQLNDCRLLKEQVAGLESQLQDEELRRKEELTTAECQKRELGQQLSEETVMYKEQSEQYALTIVALEEKLLKLMDKCNSLQTENVGLSEKLEVKTVTSEDEFRTAAEKAQNMEQLLAALRKQVSLATKEGMEKQLKIDDLKEHLKTVEKERNEHEEQLTNQHLAEVTDLRLVLSNQEATLECQKAEIQQLRQHISERSSQREQGKAQNTNESENRHRRKQQNTRPDMAEVGQQCLGEKHSDIIAKQRGVIAQLKQRVNDLELAKPPVGSHQATLKELSRVRHELLKAKAVQASMEQQMMPETDCTEALSSYHVDQEPRDDAKLQDALRQSEKSYIQLVDAICQHLPEVQRPESSKFVAACESADRLEVLKQRKQFADVVSKQLQSIQESKDDSKSSAGLDSEDRVQSPAEVISQLESLLGATSEKLEQQRRLNHALIKRKITGAGFQGQCGYLKKRANSAKLKFYRLD